MVYTGGLFFTLDELDELRKINDTEKSNLIDIDDIKIDPLQSVTQRIKNYLNQIKNPYYFLCEGTPVIIRFSDNGKTLSQKLEEHFLRQKAR